MRKQHHSTYFDEATFNDLKAISAAYAISMSSAVRLAVRQFAKINNGFIVAPSTPTPNPAILPAEKYSNEQTRLIREQNLRDYQAHTEGLKGKQPPSNTPQGLQPDVTDVSQWLKKK